MKKGEEKEFQTYFWVMGWKLFNESSVTFGVESKVDTNFKN